MWQCRKILKAGNLARPENGLIQFYGDNTYRDVVDAEINPLGGVFKKYGHSRFDPVLPGLFGRSEKLLLSDHPKLDEREITWRVHADNAIVRTGKIKLNEIRVVDISKKEEDE